MKKLLAALLLWFVPTVAVGQVVYSPLPQTIGVGPDEQDTYNFLQIKGLGGPPLTTTPPVRWTPRPISTATPLR